MEEDKHDTQEVAASLAAANEISMDGSVSMISSELVDVFKYFMLEHMFLPNPLWQGFKQLSSPQGMRCMSNVAHCSK